VLKSKYRLKIVTIELQKLLLFEVSGHVLETEDCVVLPGRIADDTRASHFRHWLYVL